MLMSWNGIIQVRRDLNQLREPSNETGALFPLQMIMTIVTTIISHVFFFVANQRHLAGYKPIRNGTGRGSGGGGEGGRRLEGD